MIRSVSLFRTSLVFIASAVMLAVGCGSPAKEDKARNDEARSFFLYDTSAYEPVEIDYHIYGSNDTTLLFIHGWNLNQSYWANQLKLSDQYKVVTLDLAGHGASGRNRENWTVESFARDIAVLIEKEALTNIVLIGHSIGGEIGLEVIRHHPAKFIGFIGVDNFKDIDFDITPEFRKSFERYLVEFKDNYEQELMELADKNCKVEDGDIMARIEEDYKAADPTIALAILKNMVWKYEQERKKLRRIKVPLHIIASDQAPYNFAALDRYAKKGYHIEWIKGAGHFPMIEKPRPFQRAMEKTLAKILLKRDSIR